MFHYEQGNTRGLGFVFTLAKQTGKLGRENIASAAVVAYDDDDDDEKEEEVKVDCGTRFLIGEKEFRQVLICRKKKF